jgi:hypothetical protein
LADSGIETPLADAGAEVAARADAPADIMVAALVGADRSA